MSIEGSSSGPSPTADRAGIVIAFLLVALAAVVAWDAYNIPTGAGAFARVGPRAFPFGIAAGLTALGIATFFQALKDTPERPRERLGPMLWIVGGLLVQIALLPVAGFSLATGAVFAGTARAFGRGPVLLVYLIGVAISLIIWLAFSRGLRLVLPSGLLESFL